MPALCNIGLLLVLFMYMYAVLGVNLFADIKVNSPMHQHLNFQTVGNSFLTLLRIATGEGWNDLLNALSLPYSLQNQCIEEPTFKHYKENNFEPQGCGRPMLAKAFFYSYILVVAITFFNLIIAVILNEYSQIVEDEKWAIK